MKHTTKKNTTSPTGFQTRALQNKLRIIGGQWRGRKLEFPTLESIRPTPDRVRETLFNWLQDYVVGARCLDLFAGSGALGFEALSRGATQAVFVDREPAIGRYLSATIERFGAVGAHVRVTEASAYLSGVATPFDIVFLDPPFGKNLLPDICYLLQHGQWLAPGACIYLEVSTDDGLPAFPVDWELFKSKAAGQVSYHLARNRAPSKSELMRHP